MITYLYNLILTVYCIFSRGAYQVMHSPTHFNGAVKIVLRRIHSRANIEFNDKIYRECIVITLEIYNFARLRIG